MIRPSPSTQGAAEFGPLRRANAQPVDRQIAVEISIQIPILSQQTRQKLIQVNFMGTLAYSIIS